MLGMERVALRTLRTAVRQEEFEGIFPDWDTGGCGVVSEYLFIDMGLRQVIGCYVATEDHEGQFCWEEGDHIAHCWNLLADGSIFDLTVDQFHDGDDIRITAGSDPRYIAFCDCMDAI